MPIYEYTCSACGHAFEALVRRGSEPACPSCRSTAIERQFSLPSVKSESTTNLAMRAAKKRDKAQAVDRVHEQRKYEQSHND